MASEDSDQLSSGCSCVHRLGDPRDLNEAVDIEVPLGRDHTHALREPREIAHLRRPERVALEKRYDRLEEILLPVDDELTQVLAVVVVTLSDVDTAHPQRSSEAPRVRGDFRRHASPQTGAPPDSRPCSLGACPDMAAGQIRWRSIPLRLQSQSPSLAESVFPAGFLHPTHCYGTANLGRYS
jgi:hypothetical protein